VPEIDLLQHNEKLNGQSSSKRNRDDELVAPLANSYHNNTSSQNVQLSPPNAIIPDFNAMISNPAMIMQMQMHMHMQMQMGNPPAMPIMPLNTAQMPLHPGQMPLNPGQMPLHPGQMPFFPFQMMPRLFGIPPPMMPMPGMIPRPGMQLPGTRPPNQMYSGNNRYASGHPRPPHIAGVQQPKRLPFLPIPGFRPSLPIPEPVNLSIHSQFESPFLDSDTEQHYDQVQEDETTEETDKVVKLEVMIYPDDEYSMVINMFYTRKNAKLCLVYIDCIMVEVTIDYILVIV
jgi:hypothetical protein